MQNTLRNTHNKFGSNWSSSVREEEFWKMVNDDKHQIMAIAYMALWKVNKCLFYQFKGVIWPLKYFEKQWDHSWELEFQATVVHLLQWPLQAWNRALIVLMVDSSKFIWKYLYPKEFVIQLFLIRTKIKQDADARKHKWLKIVL